MKEVKIRMVISILDFTNLTELIFTVMIIVQLVSVFILTNYTKLRKIFITLLFIIIVASTHLLVLCDEIFRATIEPTIGQCIHMGLILGLPALLLLTMSVFLVLYNEKKYVLLYGYFAGSSWILSLINIIFLITMTPQMILNYSGFTHLIHILFGGLGMFTSFVSMLFGIAAQRNIAKFTGYFILIFWWSAFLLSLYIPSI